MNLPFPKPLDYALHQTPPVPCAVYDPHQTSSLENPPPQWWTPPLTHPSTPSLLGAFKHPPPKEKAAMENMQPPPRKQLTWKI